mgnify:CR=1 FL=1
MKSLIKYFLIFLLANTFLIAQQKIFYKTHSDTFYYNNKLFYSLSKVFVDSSSIQFIKNGNIYKPNYIFNKNRATIKILSKNDIKTFDTLIICYKYIDVNIPKIISNTKDFIIVDKYDSNYVYTDFKKNDDLLDVKQYFGNNIITNGYLYRGFSFGTNQDIQLNSGLRLEMNGYLTEDIYLTAALNDENTPIMPEGNTEKIQEFDKIYITAKHKNFNMTFGDFDYNKNLNSFLNISRKLQGIDFSVFYKDIESNVSYANQRGKFYTYTFNPSSEFQGPYNIYGLNGEKDIIIIAGSEKVYLDGRELKRGENNDYVIDYTNAQITFTSKVVLYNYSKISIDFEYTSLKYRRNFISSNFAYKPKNEKYSFNVSFVSESDDYKNAVNFTLSDEDKKIIKNAKDNYKDDYKSGVVYVENGRGYYQKVDTLIDGKNFSYYSFKPGDTLSKYIVNFSYVGENNGDYKRKSTTEYVFVGINKGDYLPITFLPVPEKKYLIASNFSYEPFEKVKLDADFALNSFTPNALNSYSILAPASSIKLNSSNLKLSEDFTFSFDARTRYIAKNFNSFNRLNDVNFERNYNLSNIQLQGDEYLNELNSQVNYANKLNLGLGFGNLKKGVIKSNKYNLDYKHNILDNTILYYNLVLANNKDNLYKGDLKSNKAGFSSSISILDFGTNLTFLSRINKEFSGKYYSNSEKYNSYAFFTKIKYNDLDFKYEFENMMDYGLLNNNFISQSRNYLHNLGMNYFSRNILSNTTVIFRERKYTKEFLTIGYSNYNSLTLKNISTFKFFRNGMINDLYYEVSTLKSQTYQRVFIKVKKGTGNYSYVGDLNNNGIADESEFKLNTFDGDYIQDILPRSDLEPVTDLKFSYRLKLNFSEIDYLKFLNTETYFRVEENSKDNNKMNIYLLKLNKFFNEVNSLRASQLFWQDVNLFEYSDEFNLKYRYLSRKNLVNYVSGFEKGIYHENIFKIMWKLVEEISNENEYRIYRDNYYAPKDLNRARFVAGNNFITTFSYKPIKEILVDIIYDYNILNDSYPLEKYQLKRNTQKVIFSYFVSKGGIAKLEFERTELLSNNSKAIIPFDVLMNYEIGRNYYLRFNANMELWDSGILSASYNFKRNTKNETIQYFSAEVKILL